MNEIIAEAKRLYNAGLNVLPIKLGEKHPWYPHAQYHDERMQWPDLILKLTGFAEGEQAQHIEGMALAVLGGAVSGNLTCLDFDNHKGDKELLYEKWKKAIPAKVFEKLVIYKTPHDGYHVCWRSPKVFPKSVWVLARYADGETAIESLWGKKINVVPSPLDKYSYVQSHLAEVQMLDDWSSAKLLEEAAWLNQQPRKKKEVKAPRQVERPKIPGLITTFDDFNERATWEEILEPKDWQTTDGKHWTRPGKIGGCQAQTSENVFYCYSTNALPVEHDKGYNKAGLYTCLYHGGDFSAAGRELRAKGYGSDYKLNKQISDWLKRI